MLGSPTVVVSITRAGETLERPAKLVANYEGILASSFPQVIPKLRCLGKLTKHVSVDSLTLLRLLRTRPLYLE